MIRKIISKMISKLCGRATTGLFWGIMIRKRLYPNHSIIRNPNPDKNLL